MAIFLRVLSILVITLLDQGVAICEPIPTAPKTQMIDIAIDVSGIGASRKVTSFCHRLGAGLTKKPAIGRRGPWVGYRCKTKTAEWLLKVDQTDISTLTFTLSKSKDKNSSTIWTEQNNFNARFNEVELDLWVKYVAWRVSEKAPALGRILGKDINKLEVGQNIEMSITIHRKTPASVKEKFKDELLPKDIVVYRAVKSEDGEFIPEIILEASSNAGPEVAQPPAEEKEKSSEAPKESISKTVGKWKVTKIINSNPIKDLEVLYFQNKAGSGFISVPKEWINQFLPKVTSSLLSSIINRIQIGARFGVGLASSPSVLKKTKVVGVLLESKAGASSGLKAYYDVNPRAKVVDGNGILTSVYSSRFVVGWALSTPLAKLTNGFLQSLDITPKVGGWSFDASLPVEFEDGSVESRGFETKRAFSLGWEASLELGWPFLSGRLWYGGDFAGVFRQKLSETKISQHRYGADLFVRLFDFGDPKTPNSLYLLLFVYNESVSLQNSSVSESQAENAGTINDLNYKNTFLGSGFSLAL